MGDLTQQRLRELLHYDPEAGEFWWLIRRGRAKAASLAGHVGRDGYRLIRVDGKLYPAHRLAWFYMTGEWPAGEVDHINGARADNRWVNLREATRVENAQNSRKRNDNTSGHKGVTWCAGRRRWMAQITIDKRGLSLGYFTDIDAAAAAYAEASKKHHGAFGRLA